MEETSSKQGSDEKQNRQGVLSKVMDGLFVKECLHHMALEKYSLEEGKLLRGGGSDEEKLMQKGRF